jgi:hypothetical protein
MCYPMQKSVMFLWIFCTKCMGEYFIYETGYEILFKFDTNFTVKVIQGI